VSVALAPKHVGRKGTIVQKPEIFQGDSPRRLVQGAFFGAVVTVVAGFYLGGWTLGSTAHKQVQNAEQATVIRVLAPICADKFKNAADASANLEALNKADSWKRDEMIVKAGWATFPGSEPDRQVADACAKLLAQVK
jgi:hypothetical protein